METARNGLRRNDELALSSQDGSGRGPDRPNGGLENLGLSRRAAGHTPVRGGAVSGWDGSIDSVFTARSGSAGSEDKA